MAKDPAPKAKKNVKLVDLSLKPTKGGQDVSVKGGATKKAAPKPHRV